MGRYYSSKKIESDSLKKIQTWWLKRHGYLDEDCWKSGGIKWTNGWSDTESSVSISVDTYHEDRHLRITYTKKSQEGDKKDFDYKIPLTFTPCYYGGKRYWFICPWYANGIYCGRRVSVLYLGSDYFGCRHCYDLTYESRNENRRYKMYHLFSLLSDSQKMEDLENQVKRDYYGGRPTRKQRQLDKLYSKMLYRNMLLKESGILK